MIFGSNQKLLMARAGVKPSGPVFDFRSASLSQQQTFPTSVGDPYGPTFSLDGLHVFVTSASGTPFDVVRFDLSTPWDVSTATYNASASGNVGTGIVRGVFLKGDGTKAVVFDFNQGILELSLSTAFDFSSATTSNTLNALSDVDDLADLHVSNGGTEIYILNNDFVVYQYTCSSAWDLSSASATPSGQVSVAQRGGLWLKNDGTELAILSGSPFDNNLVYALSTPYDITTATLDYSGNRTGAISRGLYVNEDTAKFYGINSTSLAEYDM